MNLTASPSQNPKIDLSSTSILVGASFEMPSAQSVPALSTKTLNAMAEELSQLREALSQIKFGERVPLESTITKDAHRFSTAKDQLVQQLDALANNIDCLAQKCEALYHPERALFTDFKRDQIAINEVKALTQEQLTRTNAFFTDLVLFKESAQRLGLSGVNVALFTTIVKTAQEHTKTLLEAFHQETGRHALLLERHHDSFQKLQSELIETSAAPGYFQIIASPQTSRASKEKKGDSLLSRFQNTVTAAYAKFSEKRESLSRAIQNAVNARGKEEDQKRATKLERLRNSISNGIIEGIRSGRVFDALPYFGNIAIARRINQLESTIKKSEASLTHHDQSKQKEIKRELRKELAGTEFTYSKDVPKEIVLAAIPLNKKDSLISMRRLVEDLRESTQNQALTVDTEGSLVLTNSNNESLKIVNRGDGKMRLYLNTNGEWAKLGSAWSDDAKTIARRFLQCRDLGIVSRGKLEGDWYIPAPSYFDDLNRTI